MRTLILGATNNESRYAFKAASMLLAHGHEIFPVGIRNDVVLGRKIQNTKELIDNIDTITLYVSPKNQVEWYDFILNTAPRRLIFNPDTENPDLKKLAESHGIVTEEACTLVLLATNQF